LYSVRTDLALEARESFPGDGGEIEGVILEKETKYLDGKDESINISTVRITNKEGETVMNKPIGSYITVELGSVNYNDDGIRTSIIECIGNCVKELCGELYGKRIMVAGLGNRYVTADSLGPFTIDNLNVSRHLAMEYGYSFLDEIGMGEICAIAPGVMAQTGMETEEILSSLADNIKPDVIFVIDALAARSVSRVATTVQITDTGIKPGSGVGNHRVGLDRNNLDTKVIAIGVPTVVEAEVIVGDRIEDFMFRQGFNSDEIETFLNNMGEPAIKDMYVTPKNIDETVKQLGELIAEVINTITAC